MSLKGANVSKDDKELTLAKAEQKAGNIKSETSDFQMKSLIALRPQLARPAGMRATDRWGGGRWVVPPKTRVTLPFRNYRTGAAATSHHQVYAMACFDPDITGGAVQPVGLDQWFALYTKCRVMGARVRMNAGMQSSQFYHVSTWFSTNTALPATENAVGGQLDWKGGWMLGTGSKGYVATHKVHCPTYYGLTDKEYVADDSFWGTAAANQTNIIYWHIYTTLDGATNFTTYSDDVVYLDVEFFEPVQLASS